MILLHLALFCRRLVGDQWRRGGRSARMDCQDGFDMFCAGMDPICGDGRAT